MSCEIWNGYFSILFLFWLMCCPFYTFTLWFSWLFFIYGWTEERAKGSAADRTALIHFVTQNMQMTGVMMEIRLRSNGPFKVQRTLGPSVVMLAALQTINSAQLWWHFLSISANTHSTYSNTRKWFFSLSVSASFSSFICRYMRTRSLHTFIQCLRPCTSLRRERPKRWTKTWNS